MNRCPYCFKPLPENGNCDCCYPESENAKIEDALKPGTIIGVCYMIGGVLGQGGFGITYKGFDLNLEKEVAIKEFYPRGLVTRAGVLSEYSNISATKTSRVVALNSKSADVYNKSLNMFLKEAKILARLSKYSNVVHVYQYFTENNTAYFVMDYVKGKSLNQILKQNGRAFTENELLPLMDPILNVLEKVHAEEILHRDIAPDNIIIDEEGKPILLDFGAAKANLAGNNTDGVEASTMSSVIVEKKGFTALEQIDGRATIRSDIYSLGATYYYLLTKKVLPASYLRAANDSVHPLTEYGISQPVSNAVMKAISVAEQDRWNSVSEFHNALNEVDEAPAVPPTEIFPPSPPKPPAPSNETGSNGKDPKKVILLILVMLVLIGGGVFFFLRGRTSKPQYITGMTNTSTIDLAETSPYKSVQTEGDTIGMISTNTAVPTETSILIPTDTFTPVPTDTVIPTPTNTPVPTDTNTPVPTETFTPIPTDTATLKPTETATMVSTDTVTPVPSSTNTLVPTNTDTSVSTETYTPIPTDTNTPIPTDTATSVPTDTHMPIPTETKEPGPAPKDIRVGLGTSYYTIDDVWRGLSENSGSIRILFDKIESLEETQIIQIPDNKGITEVILDSEKKHMVHAYNVRLYANGIPLTVSENVTFIGLTVFGGGYAIGNTEKIIPESNVSIYGSVYDVYAGGEIRGAGANQGRSIVNNANISVYGTVVHNVYGGGYAVGNGSISHVEESHLFLDRRVQVNNMLYYGGFVGALCQYGTNASNSTSVCEQEFGTVTLGTVYADIRGDVRNGINRSSNGIAVLGQKDPDRYCPAFKYVETPASLFQDEAPEPVYQEVTIGYGKDFDRISNALSDVNVKSDTTDLTIKIDNYYNYTELYAIVIPYLGKSLERVTIDADTPVTINMQNLPIYANGVQLTIGSNITLNNSTIYGGILANGGKNKKDSASLIIAGTVGTVFAGSYVGCPDCVSEIDEATVLITGNVRNHVYCGGNTVGDGSRSIIGTTNLILTNSSMISGNLIMGGIADYNCDRRVDICDNPGSAMLHNVNAAVYGKITGDILEDGLSANGALSTIENMNYVQAPSEEMMSTEYPQVLYVDPYGEHKTIQHALQSIRYPGKDVTIRLKSNFALTDDVILPDNKQITSVTFESESAYGTSINMNDKMIYANGIPLTITEKVTMTGGSIFAGGVVYSGEKVIHNAYLLIEGTVSSVYGGSASYGVGKPNQPCVITTDNATLIIKGKIQNNVYAGGYSIGSGSKSNNTGITKLIITDTAEIRGNLFFGGNSQSEIDSDLIIYCSGKKQAEQCTNENIYISTTVDDVEAAVYGTVWGKVVYDGQSASEKSNALLRNFRFKETDPENMNVSDTQEIFIETYNSPINSLEKAFQKVAYTDNGTDVIIYLKSNQELAEDLEIPYDKNLKSVLIASDSEVSFRSINFRGHIFAAGGVPLTIGKNIVINDGSVFAGKLVKNETGGNINSSNRLSLTAENAKLTILGRVPYIYGGGKAIGDAAESIVLNSVIDIDGEAKVDAVLGGGSAVNSGHTAVENILIHLGPAASINQNIYCGGHAEITSDKGLNSELMHCYNSLDACMTEESEANCKAGNDAATGRTCVFRISEQNKKYLSLSEVNTITLNLEGRLPEPAEDHILNSGLQKTGGTITIGSVEIK